jgi:hypothetical protein
MLRTATTMWPGKTIRRFGDPRDIKVNEWLLENETIQILKPTYRAVHDFLRERGWAHPLSGDEVCEDLYWERWNHVGQKEQWIWWRWKLDINDYIRYLVVLDWQTLYVTEAETVYKGKKVKAESINLKLYAKFYLQFDIFDRFKNSIGWKLKKMFFNRMYIQEINQQKEEIMDFSLKLKLLTKGLMTLEREGEWPASQYGPLGYAQWGEDEPTRVT